MVIGIMEVNKLVDYVYRCIKKIVCIVLQFKFDNLFEEFKFVEGDKKEENFELLKEGEFD